MNRYYWIIFVMLVAATVSSCSGISNSANHSSGSPETGQRIIGEPSSTLPAISGIPRTASGYSQINGDSFIFAAGVSVQNHAAKLSLNDGGASAKDGEHPADPTPQLAYAIYRFTNITAPVVGLNINTSSHNVSPMWIAVPDDGFTHWTFPFQQEFSSAELWNTMTGIDLNRHVSPQQELLVAVVLADDEEDITIYNLELVLLTDVSEATASSNLDDQIRLDWTSPSRSIATTIFRRMVSTEPAEWILLTPEHLENSEVTYLDRMVEAGVDYEYCIRSAFGPRLDYKNSCWSSGAIVKGRTLITSIELPSIEQDQITSFQAVNWYNHLGVIGAHSGDNTDILAMTALSFPPSSIWRTFTTDDGVDDVQLAASPDTSGAITTFMFTTDNNEYITLCYSSDNGMFSQIAHVDELNNVTWRKPVQIDQGFHQIVGCFQMSRRIGLLTWNAEDEKLVIYDSVDQIGQSWFDIDQWDWPWRVLPGKLPSGPVDSMYSNSGEVLCFTETSTNQLKFYAMPDAEWIDYSPGITAGPGPQVCDAVPDLFPGFAIVYITEDESSVKLLRREMFEDWQLDSQVIIRNGAEPGSITGLAAFCPAQFAARNHIAYIESGDVYYCMCNSWNLNDWSAPQRIDDSGTCENVQLIRIGSDEEYHYGIYLTYFTREDDNTLRFHFRAVDNRFIPQP